jgi:putative transposase
MARAYNQRKRRKGAFWEDRYHATVVDNGEHLLQCIVYIDLNMVRAGGVSRPLEWPFCGYREIQHPRRKCALIAYERLWELVGFDTYDQFRAVHRDWVNGSLGQGTSMRDSMWTRSITVGSERFVHRTKKEFGARAKGRVIVEAGEAFNLREPGVSYLVGFGSKNDFIGAENEYF